MSSTGNDKRRGVYIFGCGSVGTALALRLMRSGQRVVGAHTRGAESARRAGGHLGLEVTHGAEAPAALASASVVIIAVPDPEIRKAAEALARRGALGTAHVVLHCSGARNAEELEPLRHLVLGVGSFHPLLSFADPQTAAELLAGASFALEGDAAALEAAAELVEAMGGQVLHVHAAHRVLYHAAAATASNHLVALAAGAAACMEPLGIEGDKALKALLPLMKSTLANLERLGLPRALTGPVSRGDSRCVAGHLGEIERRAPAELEPYRVMARRALVVAREQAVAGREALDAVSELLETRT